jgi:hypothetical protein
MVWAIVHGRYHWRLGDHDARHPVVGTDGPAATRPYIFIDIYNEEDERFWVLIC